MVLEFKEGDKVIVNGSFEGEVFDNTVAVIKKINLSKSSDKGEYFAYNLEFDKENHYKYTWWVITDFEKKGPTGLMMTKIDEIKEEDIEWF